MHICVHVPTFATCVYFHRDPPRNSFDPESHLPIISIPRNTHLGKIWSELCPSRRATSSRARGPRAAPSPTWPRWTPKVRAWPRQTSYLYMDPSYVTGDGLSKLGIQKCLFEKQLHLGAGGTCIPNII